ncbi:hypothetical protein KIN20_009406 [Parelaphostrongylus tenuis]|uniref:Uncharacterized protein n=1 Tax=Parelaphostrongylus tenuis TaxID=148309 RepID=A0AAD5MXR5_PARTN|nr:hypothetical protein KIN20_009406 [Parelaphostrongylus tenuis]
MDLDCINMIEADHHHGRHLCKRETNENYAGARTTSEDGPSKYRNSLYGKIGAKMRISNGWLSYYGDLLVRVPCHFTEYGQQHQGVTWQKNEAAWAAFGSLKEATDQITDSK